MIPAPIYQVDAFTSAVFHGNPAAVCLLSSWLSDALLQAVAAENNLSETAFVLADRDPAPLRWFTPTEEVPLCGHATLAAGFVVLNFLAPDRKDVTFRSALPGFRWISPHVISRPATASPKIRTGSIHCSLGPYWSERLGRRSLEARQLSARGGHLGVAVGAGGVQLRGDAVCYMAGEIYLPPSNRSASPPP